MDFHFPFAVENKNDQKLADFNYLKSNSFYLNLSQYPVKQMILVDPSDLQ